LKKDIFLANSDVQDFIDWCSENLPSLEVNLRIGCSRFVPNRISENAKGMDDVLWRYMWRATGISIGDWKDTERHLTALANNLRYAVNSGNNHDALAACDAILAWGGDRNREVGAYPFLRGQINLCEYIRRTGNAFILETADEAGLASPVGPVGLMNSMLTKVHALFSEDGLFLSMIHVLPRLLHP
jgi:hypothetical protein